DRKDPVLPRGEEEPLAGLLLRVVVLEPNLAEARERRTHVALVVDREPPGAVAVDVGERPVGELPSLLRGQVGHRRKITTVSDVDGFQVLDGGGGVPSLGETSGRSCR